MLYWTWACPVRNRNYYSFKIFPRFSWVKTTRIIQHKQLLSYWTKSAVCCRLLNDWRQNDVKSAVRCRKPGHRIVSFNKLRNDREYSLQVWAKKIFWMNNKAIIEFGFRKIWRILQISEGVIHLGLWPRWITLSSTCRILHILLSLIQ